MPRNQPTSAKKARAAARETGAKYTEALRAERGQEQPATVSAETLRRWREANDASANADELAAMERDEAAGRPYDPYAAAHATSVRGQVFEDLAAELAEAARTGRPVELDAAAAEVLAIACDSAAAMDEFTAARMRLESAIPTITPRAEAAKLRVIRCSACGAPWSPHNRGYCTQCPRLYFGPTPRTREQAEATAHTAVLLTADDFADPAFTDD